MRKSVSLTLALSLSLTLAACAPKPPVLVPPETLPPTAAPTEAPAAGIDLTILYEQDDSMINTYSLIAVDENAPFADADGNPVDDVTVNTTGAEALIRWMLSGEGTTLIADYGVADYGEHLFYLLDERPLMDAETNIPQATDETRVIRLSTTTSVNDSGLLSYLLPAFEDTYGYTVEVSSAGTGKAIAAAQYGNADLILVHSKSQEEAFVGAGFGKTLEGCDSARLPFMYNYFVLCGPSADPAGCANAASVKDAFRAIADGQHTFISRGDKSGTHTKEVSLWPEELGITAEVDSVAGYTDWYVSSNAGMGVCLTMAEEMGGYILSDKATYLTFRSNQGVMG